jgi:hypothetical protein
MYERRRLAAVSIAGACLLVLAVSCGGGEKTVTGMVTDVVERNLSEVELLRVRDRSDNIWEFTTSGNIGMSPAHLKQHQVLGQGVLVAYKTIDGRLVVSKIRDLATP